MDIGNTARNVVQRPHVRPGRGAALHAGADAVQPEITGIRIKEPGISVYESVSGYWPKLGVGIGRSPAVINIVPGIVKTAIIRYLGIIKYPAQDREFALV